MRTLLLSVLALGLVLGLSGMAQAVTIIDNFDDNTGTVSLFRTTAGTSTDTDTGLSGVLGGSRRTSLTLTSSQFEGRAAAARLNPPDNQILLSADNGVDATYELFYGGSSGTDVGIFDPDSDGTTQFEIVFLLADSGAMMTITLTNGAITTSKTVNLAFGGAQTLVITYAGGWSGGHTVGQGSFTDIDTTTVTIVGASAGDYTIDEIRTGGIIPEPNTGLLVIAGLLGLAGWRRVRA